MGLSYWEEDLEEKLEREEIEFFQKNLKHNGESLKGFKIGETVLFINDVGVDFIMEILGFSDDGRVHFVGKDSPYWYGNTFDNVFKMPENYTNINKAVDYVQGYYKENPHMAYYGIDFEMHEKIEEILKNG